MCVGTHTHTGLLRAEPMRGAKAQEILSHRDPKPHALKTLCLFRHSHRGDSLWLTVSRTPELCDIRKSSFCADPFIRKICAFYTYEFESLEP